MFIFVPLGVVYYTLGNIDPKHRSQCDAIQLLLIATTPIIKQYGIDALLEPFMNDLEYLEQVGEMYSERHRYRQISSFGDLLC